MILIFIACTVISGMISLAEMYYERDWPRETGKYFLGFAALTAFWVSL